MKKIIYSFVFMTALFLTFSVSEKTQAASDTEAVLENKGYSDDEINSMNDTTKEKLANSEGTRADYTVTQKEYYNSLDGKKYEVTDENRSEINKIMERDIAQYTKKAGISVMRVQSPMTLATTSYAGDSYEDNNISVNAYVDKTTSSNSATEYAYKAFLDFSWFDTPAINFTDQIGLAWDNRFIGLANTLDDYYTYLYAQQYMYSKSIDTDQELYGFKGKFTLERSAFQVGGMSQTIKVPTKYKNQTGKFQAKYVHALIPFNIGIGIGAASVEVPTDFASQEFVLDFNLTIGS